MVKRLLLTTCAAVLCLSFIPGAGHTAGMVKIGVVDLQKALNATTEGVAAKERLKKKHEAKQEQIDARKKELDALEEKIKSPVLSEDAKKDLERDYVTKRNALIDFVSKAKEEEEKENQQVSSGILDGLVEIATEIAQKENFTVILEKTGGGVVYFEPGLDLTENVIKIYNERHQGGQGK